MIANTVRRFIEEQTWIDGIAEPIQRAIESVLKRAPAVAGVLHGKFLGHPLHAALIVVPIGAWSCTLVLDMVSLVSGGAFRSGADATCAIGLAGALTAAFAGLADWSHTVGAGRRAGFIHGAVNLAVAGIYGASLASRLVGLRLFGITLSTIGFGLVGFTGWLGGELSYLYGVGVSPEGCAREGEGYRGPEGHKESVKEEG
jgi:uncharacterized membrane protein